MVIIDEAETLDHTVFMEVMTTAIVHKDSLTFTHPLWVVLSGGRQNSGYSQGNNYLFNSGNV